MFSVRPFEAKTLSWWYNRRPTIDMSPPYQRQGEIWSDRDKAYLIDSILNGYDLPKIYVADFSFANTRLNLKQLQYAVIDGKQRFETIFDFFDGKFVLAKDFVYEDDPSRQLGGLSYRDLKLKHPDVTEKFENFNLSVMSVITDDEAKINSLFVRLNTSKPLTGAELRNAMAGPIPELIRRLAGHEFFESKVRFQTRRGQDRNVAAKLLIIEFRGQFVDVKKTHLDRFVQEAMRANARLLDFERAADRAQSILDEMSQIFTYRDYLLSSQGPIPVYYWLVRELDEDRRSQVRAFLVAFDRERQRNKMLAKDVNTADQVDLDLVRYENFNRSTNDVGSLEGRFEILWRRFNDFERATHADRLTLNDSFSLQSVPLSRHT